MAVLSTSVSDDDDRSVRSLLNRMMGPERPHCRCHRSLCDMSLVAAAAPMVRGSDLPFRLLTRSYGTTVAYTQMYAAEELANPTLQWPVATCPSDFPLILQLAGRDPHAYVAALRRAQRELGHALVAIDINLGCPQSSARDGGYGAYMTDERDWHLVVAVVRACVEERALPITAKIRLQDSAARTEEFVCMLQSAGVAAVCVHARLRGTPKAPRGGAADLAALAALRASPRVSIPIIANGNVRCHADVHAVAAATGCDGVMSAEALLTNPALFSCAHAACEHAPADDAMHTTVARHDRACACDDVATTPVASTRPLPPLIASPHVLRMMHEQQAPIPAHAALAHALVKHYLSLLRVHPAVLHVDAAAHIAWMLGRVGRGNGKGECFVHAGGQPPATLRAALILDREARANVTPADIDALEVLASRIFERAGVTTT